MRKSSRRTQLINSVGDSSGSRNESAFGYSSTGRARPLHRNSHRRLLVRQHLAARRSSWCGRAAEFHSLVRVGDAQSTAAGNDSRISCYCCCCWRRRRNQWSVAAGSSWPRTVMTCARPLLVRPLQQPVRVYTEGRWTKR